MAMMRFTRLLNKSGLRLVSVAKKAIIGLLVVVIVFFIGRIYESHVQPYLQDLSQRNRVVHMRDPDLSAGLPSVLHELLLPAHQYAYQLLHIQ